METRSFAPYVSIVDILDGLVWHRDGSVSVVYRLDPYEEAGMSDDDFDAASAALENAISGLPEGSAYQVLMEADHEAGRRELARGWPPISGRDEVSRVFEELRAARMKQLVARDPLDGSLVQARRHHLVATFQPDVLPSDRRQKWTERLAALRGLVTGEREVGGAYARAYKETLERAESFDKRVSASLVSGGLGFERCGDAEMIGLLYRALNPSAAEWGSVERLSERTRRERDNLPRSILEEYPFLEPTSVISDLLDDDLVVRKGYLRVGDYYVGIVSLRQLPDNTEPGMIVPLLHLPQQKYRVSYRVEILHQREQIQRMKTRGRLAAGLQLRDMVVDSQRGDKHAAAIEQQADRVLEEVIGSTQRITGVSLQVILYERSAQALSQATESVVAAMARIHGLRGRAEGYMLREVYASTLPGGAAQEERRRRALTRTAVDLMPVFDTRPSKGKVPFLTPNNSVIWYDPFKGQSNANVLITGEAGWGKSVAAISLVSGYEIACKARKEPPPYVFVLDNGASYRRYLDLRSDARFVQFSFENPPGVDVWAHSDEEPLEQHVSRLEQLILDLLRVDRNEEERFERVKSAVERGLMDVYRDGGERSFAGLAEALKATGTEEAQALAEGLYPYISGKFARLFCVNDAMAMSEEVHAICYDFTGLGEHKDLLRLALRLSIYVVRRWAARMSARGHRTVLLLDESWAVLEKGLTESASSSASAYLNEVARLGRKEGLSLLSLSQNFSDFAEAACGNAIIANSSTFLLGPQGNAGLGGYTKHLDLTARQQEQVQKLRRSSSWAEFLMIRDRESSVVRVVLDPFTRWVFTTAPDDRRRLRELEEKRKDLTLIERLRLLAKEAA